MNLVDLFLKDKSTEELIEFFKEFHLGGRVGHGHLFASLIEKVRVMNNLSNKETAKLLGISKSLVYQAKYYLNYASNDLMQWIEEKSVGINKAYWLTRIENYEHHNNLLPWRLLDFISLKNAPIWIYSICLRTEPIRNEYGYYFAYEVQTSNKKVVQS